MRRETWIQVTAGVTAAAALAAAGALMPRINAIASDAQLRYTEEAAEGAPAPVVVAQSVGVLRGLITNYLWIRADNLKEDGKFYEAAHLADWITKLQPRFAKVWAFHGWNMAYNISVVTNTREERWQWVQNGVDLIRNQGLRYNPNDMMLYKELSWYFMHKIGGFTDDAHRYYKQQMADRWQGILGEPPFEHEARAAAIKEIADAPERLEGVAGSDPAAAELIAAVRAAGLSFDEEFLRAVEMLRQAETSYLGEKLSLADRLGTVEELESMDPAIRSQIEPLVRLRPLLNDSRYAQVWPVLLAHVRKRVLVDDYNMDPYYMWKYTQEYGPLDWRSPAAHSLYWAALGVEKGLTRINQLQFDQINTDRLIFHSEQLLKQIGRIHYDYVTKELAWGPDLRFVPFYEKAYRVVLDRLVAKGPGAERTYWDGYRNFLIDAVREFYQWGEYAKAQEYYRRLRTTPELADRDRPDRFTYPIDEFIVRETADRYGSIRVARNDIYGLTVTALRHGLARGNKQVLQSNLNTAQYIYDYFMEFVGPRINQVTGEALVVPSPTEALPLAFESIMLDPGVPWTERMALWERAPDALKLMKYDAVVPQMRRAYEAQRAVPMAFDAAFPPPPGLEAYRARRGQDTEQRDWYKELQLERH